MKKIKELNESVGLISSYKEDRFTLLPVSESAFSEFFIKDSENVSKFAESDIINLNEDNVDISYNLFRDLLSKLIN